MASSSRNQGMNQEHPSRPLRRIAWQRPTLAALVLPAFLACGANVQVGKDNPEGGAGGSSGAPSGALGATCLRGERVTEANGTPAEAEIEIPQRCNEGLSCNAAKVCEPTPDCAGPLTTECVVYSNGAGGGEAEPGQGVRGLAA